MAAMAFAPMPTAVKGATAAFKSPSSIMKLMPEDFILDSQNQRRVILLEQPEIEEELANGNSLLPSAKGVAVTTGAAVVEDALNGDTASIESIDDADMVTINPSGVGFVSIDTLLKERQEALQERIDNDDNECTVEEILASLDVSDRCSKYPPFAKMLSGSARYIASHAGEIIVLYIPGELLEQKDGGGDATTNKAFDLLVDDIALSWLLGLKIVIVMGCTNSCPDPTAATSTKKLQWDGWAEKKEGVPVALVSDKEEDESSIYVSNSQDPFEIPSISDAAMRLLEEDAGYVRFELERKLNKCMIRHVGLSPAIESNGNVVGGNFYTTTSYGPTHGYGDGFNYSRYSRRTRGKIGLTGKSKAKEAATPAALPPPPPPTHTGYASEVHVRNILAALSHKDIVVLTTIGASIDGDLIHVNGPHLAATVAAECKAHKVIYMTQKGMVLQRGSQMDGGNGGVAGDDDEDYEDAGEFLQDVPLTFVESVLEEHGIQIHPQGFIARNDETSDAADKDAEDDGKSEMLMDLSWAAWAVNNGVTRAHIVNPGNGAMLEELFTEQHGTNTCLFHDNELM